jgi:hypothetical protein
MKKGFGRRRRASAAVGSGIEESRPSQVQSPSRMPSRSRTDTEARDPDAGINFQYSDIFCSICYLRRSVHMHAACTLPAQSSTRLVHSEWGGKAPEWSSSGENPKVRLGDVDPFSHDMLEVKKRSVLAFKHGASHKEVDEGTFPTNEQVVHALQQKVSKSVEVARRYRRVLWYSIFVLVYLTVLYLQASAYKSADVVSTLRNALMVDGQLSMTFNNEDEVLSYIANKILLPTWKDPVCGDGAVAAHRCMGDTSSSTIGAVSSSEIIEGKFAAQASVSIHGSSRHLVALAALQTAAPRQTQRKLLSTSAPTL